MGIRTSGAIIEAWEGKEASEEFENTCQPQRKVMQWSQGSLGRNRCGPSIELSLYA